MRGIRLSLKIHFQSISGPRDRLGEELLGSQVTRYAKRVPKWLDYTSLLKRELSDEPACFS